MNERDDQGAQLQDDRRGEREAMNLVFGGGSVNQAGISYLLSWLQRAPVNHPDRAHVQSAVDRYYTAQPGADAPVQVRDTFVIAPAGGSGSTRGMRGER
jgi:hypothetical protein